MRSHLIGISLCVACVACAGKTDYRISWTIDAVRPGGARWQFATGLTTDVPELWSVTGRNIRIVHETPVTPHDTVGILYWHHTEVPLVTKSRDTDCRTVTRPGSVTTRRVCYSQIYRVEAQCDGNCRQKILRAVADSLDAETIIVAEERLVFRGLDGEQAIVPQTYAQNDGFRGTYVMIVSRAEPMTTMKER